MTADGSGELLNLKIWDGFTYFEQGSSPPNDRVKLPGQHDGCTLTRSMVRADVHRILAEEKALETVVLSLVEPLASGESIRTRLLICPGKRGRLKIPQ